MNWLSMGILLSPICRSPYNVRPLQLVSCLHFFISSLMKVLWMNVADTNLTGTYQSCIMENLSRIIHTHVHYHSKYICQVFWTCFYPMYSQDIWEGELGLYVLALPEYLYCQHYWILYIEVKGLIFLFFYFYTKVPFGKLEN